MSIRALDSPTGILVEVLALTREGYAKVRALTPGATSFETLASRLHKVS